MSDTLQERFRNKNVIVGSVAKGPFSNFGNALIERSTFTILDLPSATPRFSVFEQIDDALLETINTYDYLVITGCTTLQDDPGHQKCFDANFEKINIPRICFGGTFYCEPEDKPSLRVARMFDCAIGTRDPWAADYLASSGIACELVGCPTLLDQPDRQDWISWDAGETLVSSDIEPMPQEIESPRAGTVRLVAHDARTSGEDLRLHNLFENASLVVTSRLHGALPAIARGIPVRFFDERLLKNVDDHGSVRYSLLRMLGVPGDGSASAEFPARCIGALRDQCDSWLGRIVGL